MTATDFTNRLLSTKPEFSALSNFLYEAERGLNEPFHLFSTATKRYILKKHYFTFAHKGGTPVRWLNLVCNDFDHVHDPGTRKMSQDKARNAGISTTLTLGTDLHPQKLEDTSAMTFLSLGWLDEIRTGSTADGGKLDRCTTNYVVLLNVSTKPMSLWLAYDYYTSNHEWEHNSLFNIYNRSYYDADDERYHIDEGNYGFSAEVELHDAEKEALGTLRNHVGLLNDFKAFR